GDLSVRRRLALVEAVQGIPVPPLVRRALRPERQREVSQRPGEVRLQLRPGAGQGVVVPDPIRPWPRRVVRVPERDRRDPPAGRRDDHEPDRALEHRVDSLAHGRDSFRCLTGNSRGAWWRTHARVATAPPRLPPPSCRAPGAARDPRPGARPASGARAWPRTGRSTGRSRGCAGAKPPLPRGPRTAPGAPRPPGPPARAGRACA